MTVRTPDRPDRRRDPCAAAGWLLGAAVAFILAVAGPALAEEAWTVRSGGVWLHFNLDLLRDFGIDVQVSGAPAQHRDDVLLEQPHWTFPLRPDSDLRFHTERGIVVPGGRITGAMRLDGVLVVRDRATGNETRFDDLEIAPGSGARPPDSRRIEPLELHSAGTGLAFCELRNPMFDFRSRPGLQIHYLNARITEAGARAIGRPELAGWVVGLGEVRAMAERLSATPDAGPAYRPVFTGGILDVSLGALDDIQQVAHTGTFPNGTAAVAMATTSCNVGTVDVPWKAAMQEEHPLIHMALYRLLDGRFEQIGVSWLKHGFFALSNEDCTPCQNPSDGSFLGVGCSDTYDVGNNSSRNDLGPRGEVNAFAGTWECTGSHFAGGEPDCVRRHGSNGHGPLDHRLTVADADLGTPGATYYYEASYLVAGDQVLANNWGHRRCTMSWNGSAWTFSTPGGNPLVAGPAVAGWGDAADTVVVAPDDGEVLLAVRTTDLGGGTWRYDYALLNLSSDRQIRSLSLPVAGVPNMANMGFHDNDTDPSNDWQVTLDADTIRWQTATFAQDPNAHALAFGYMFSFRFQADAAPGAVEAILGIFKPGAGAAAAAGTTGPSNAVTAVGEAAPSARVIEVRPNPFNRSATIWYQAAAGGADLSIYDAAGRRVRGLVDAGPQAGIRSVVWDGTADDGARVRSGVYYARLRSGAMTAARSMVIVD